MSGHLSGEEAANCKKLWGDVLLLGLRDALTPDNRLSSTSGAGAAPIERRDARVWIGSRDFYEVCRLAGMDPDFVLDNYRNGRITFDGLTPAFSPRSAAE